MGGIDRAYSDDYKPHWSRVQQYEWWFQWCNDKNPQTYWERRWRDIQAGRLKQSRVLSKPPAINEPRAKKDLRSRLARWYKKYKKK